MTMEQENFNTEETANSDLGAVMRRFALALPLTFRVLPFVADLIVQTFKNR